MEKMDLFKKYQQFKQNLLFRTLSFSSKEYKSLIKDINKLQILKNF